MKVDNLYVVIKKVFSDYIEGYMASYDHLSNYSLGRRVDEFTIHGKFIYKKLSHFNSRLTSDLNSHGLPDVNMSVEAS